MRLVDGDTLLEEMKDARDYKDKCGDPVYLIENARTLARICKYCKYFTRHTTSGIDTWCNNLSISRDENFFCGDFEESEM